MLKIAPYDLQRYRQLAFNNTSERVKLPMVQLNYWHLQFFSSFKRAVVN